MVDGYVSVMASPFNLLIKQWTDFGIDFVGTL